MASAWGKSWGLAWGNSWGLVTPNVITTESVLGGAGKSLQQKIREDDEITLQIVIRCATMILGEVHGTPRTIRSSMQVRETIG